MCGIFGFVSPSAGHAPDLADALVTLRHRGPDGSGTWREDAGGWSCGLAHARLAILDLSDAGRQPMVSSDERCVLVFNGEIYNFREVRAELEAGGSVFRSNSDSEVLVEAFAQWGVECLRRLRGMFAFAIWDRAKRSLFVARDRLGVKPLYLARMQGGGIAFASELRTLMSTKLASPKLSPRGLGSFLGFGSVLEPDTILEDVRLLQAGEWLSFTEGREQRGFYWTLPTAGDARPCDPSEVRRLLVDAVRLRLVSDVPVGVFMSGGLDSAAIAALAVEATAGIRTFTVRSDESGHDEGEEAARLARELGCDHREVVLASSTMAAKMDLAVAALDQPSADGINTFFVSGAARESGLVVALSGIGSDEVFAGYGAFRRFGPALAVKRVVPVLPASSRVGALLAGSGWARGLDVLCSEANAYSVYRVLRTMFPPLLRSRLYPSQVEPPSPREAGLVERALREDSIDAVNAFGVLDLSTYVRNTLLRDTDVMSMAHSLEVREPLLDHVLVEHLLRVPGPSKLKGRGNKPLLTAAVPEVPLRRRIATKRGFTLPFERWMKGTLRGWTEERLIGACPAFLDKPTVEDMWRRFLAGKPIVSWARLWTLTVLADWCTRHRATL